ncbi:bifunctional adenosylcobinamide kinase/adenosylcobinamide-phosphate guanylyltransferase [Shewanella oneidensis MR-1]|uniref:Bifunctional adenosylcobalamin biosynthesis protein n=1 Tax=Shewanella oneidensis (strain ATCC 700550 / JCM 31522 / CIP 106686 / LMG 19005 / NCIMB 14063 / MR-1) TaxID=211586 RepID=Q8EI16_SHEON|nr:bifunctional adenosylcobinamide kinase/adenosylcobinamide-phosphate guanylyltransferase [Shewanella oneidensis]AAN54110.1 bifunctional cobinamide kinase/cobinamide phosphate guanylyltransferase CobU [Shewanella oneidensis MR-1]MDX5997085.1 bifunctional adenosylcobinamide kinase/adenosylcobinamide-phosphate guanylyltransferase [Shewanella oneidensis]MEE2028018.1 Bifunctional adenosylcobalamin biosynthesis protein CobP [Shewanella oneidensis]QKG95858.1 bifunctional adenosylcobinamide kinase/ad
MIHLVLGGARSGKSRYGETLVRQYTALGFDACYVATAQALDAEMASRIRLHQDGRAMDDIDWQLVEEPLALTARLKRLAKPGRVILVDCLTLWLSNQLLAGNPADEPASTDSDFAITVATSSKHDALAQWRQAKAEFVGALNALEGAVILISNEVGSGIVPMGELSRQFVDEAGWLNQAVAAVADNVTLVVAGLPLVLKSS